MYQAIKPAPFKRVSIKHLGLVVLFLSCAPASSWAEDKPAQSPWTYVAGASLGFTRLAFDDKLDADTTFNTYALFGSIAYDKAYVSLSFADSFGDETISEEDEIGEASRRDIDLTVGYRVTPHWSLFAGYKDGETALDLQFRDTDIVQNEYYREDGLFAGASYTFDLQQAGSLSLSLAYIRFDADLRFTEGLEEEEEEEGGGEEEEEEPAEFDDLEGDFSGNTDGFSAGAAWVMPFGDHLAVRAQLRYNQYNLEVDAEGLSFEPDQQLLFFDLGLLYVF